MKLLIQLLLLLLVSLILPGTAFSKQWRGIVPLQSTRSDVVRLLNQCSDSSEACTFRTTTEDVYIMFSGGLRGEFDECSNSLPLETVIFVEVRPIAPLKFAALHLDKRHIESFNVRAFFERGLKGYRTKDGLVVSTIRGRVIQLDYVADSKTKHACVDYYDDVEPFIQTMLVHPPPIIILDCGQRERISGERFSLWATFIETRRGFSWSVNGGKIISGQGTHKISLETTAQPTGKIVVIVEFEDAFRKVTFTTCEILVVAKGGQ